MSQEEAESDRNAVDPMTDQELKELVVSLTTKHAELADSSRESREETERVFRESRAETERVFRESREEADRQMRELRQQLGGLSDKFGSFTEGLALPSMTKILTQRFGMEVIAPRVLARQNGHSLEVDVLAYSRSRNEVFVVEVKSHLRQEALTQMQKILRDFHDFFPDHEGKKVYGILAAVDAPEQVREEVLRAGIYLARIHDGQFELQVPEDFQPRAF